MADSKSTRPGAPFFPGDRATAPMALEETGESAWARFEAIQQQHEQGFQKTEMASKPPGFDPTEQLDRGTRLPMARKPVAPRAVTLDEVMVLVRRNNRACPIPPAWAAFHQVLPARESAGRLLEPPPPVDGAAWAATSAMQKRLRLRDQIEWAERAGALAAAHEFLCGLSEEEWHHFG